MPPRQCRIQEQIVLMLGPKSDAPQQACKTRAFAQAVPVRVYAQEKEPARFLARYLNPPNPPSQADQ
jgi:hypothetical protein